MRRFAGVGSYKEERYYILKQSKFRTVFEKPLVGSKKPMV